MKKIYMELLATLGVQVIPLIFIINGIIHRNELDVSNGDGLLVLGVILLALIATVYFVTYLLNLIITWHNKKYIPKYRYWLLSYWTVVIILICVYLKLRNFFE